MPAKPARGEKREPRFHPGVFGMLNSSSEAVVVTEQGLAIKTRSAKVRRIPESERWDADRILGMRAVPWSPDGSDAAFDIQVGMDRPVEMVPGSGRSADGKQRSDLPSQSGLRTGWSQRKLSWMQVPENWSGATTSSQRSMPEED